MAPSRRAGEELQDLEEGTGESSPAPQSPREAHPDLHAVQRRICERLRLTGRHDETLADPSFHGRLARHLQRLPRRYLFDLDVENKAEDVLLHWEILQECADPEKRPVFHARYIKSMSVRADYHGIGDNQELEEPCQRLMEDLSLERRKTVDGNDSMSISSRGDLKTKLIHEIIFSSIDRPKLLSRLTALLSEVGLNIQEAHVYSTKDNFCLDVFVVDGWETEETDDLIVKIKVALAQKNASPSNSTNSSTSEKITDLQQKVGDSEIDWNMLTKGEKIASRSSADLYRGTYNGLDVAIKSLRIANLNNPSEIEFLQEVLILRQVIKIADFGVARHGSQEGQMTAETGTYRWMAPEIINHKPYDNKADVFSFAIVLWELSTSKVPYDNMTPLQAALGVRQGLRLDIPACVHPRLSKLIQRCWDENPDLRPTFAEIIVELEDILQHVQAAKGVNRRSRAKMQKKSER
ncbi:hypothetical protein C2845_PM14G00240 [Panicum miliaceum]|uniref:Serine/threonine-protein kinase STY8-like n=1 Tax=Panicum miliaceum TaxID=4540 RepID=A0A3L6PQN5_PANMI|nr:hypothetical protein C2845_PM14G00240 [Panicum miliaceum]